MKKIKLLLLGVFLIISNLGFSQFYEDYTTKQNWNYYQNSDSSNANITNGSMRSEESWFSPNQGNSNLHKSLDGLISNKSSYEIRFKYKVSDILLKDGVSGGITLSLSETNGIMWYDRVNNKLTVQNELLFNPNSLSAFPNQSYMAIFFKNNQTITSFTCYNSTTNEGLVDINKWCYVKYNMCNNSTFNLTLSYNDDYSQPLIDTTFSFNQNKYPKNLNYLVHGTTGLGYYNYVNFTQITDETHIDISSCNAENSEIAISSEKIELKCYPNPSTNGLFNIESNKSFNQVVITDRAGKLIGTWDFESTSNYILDLENIAKGIYNLSLKHDDKFLIHQKISNFSF